MEQVDYKAVETLNKWLAMHDGDVEALARWMRDSLRVGGMKANREIILQATAKAD